jgi:hypothetical protein
MAACALPLSAWALLFDRFVSFDIKLEATGPHH